MMNGDCKNNTFVKVTNGMIYDKICDLESHVKETNGKVKLNRWLASTALTLVLMSIGLLMKVII